MNTLFLNFKFNKYLLCSDGESQWEFCFSISVYVIPPYVVPSTVIMSLFGHIYLSVFLNRPISATSFCKVCAISFSNVISLFAIRQLLGLLAFWHWLYPFKVVIKECLTFTQLYIDLLYTFFSASNIFL